MTVPAYLLAVGILFALLAALDEVEGTIWSVGAYRPDRERILRAIGRSALTCYAIAILCLLFAALTAWVIR